MVDLIIPSETLRDNNSLKVSGNNEPIEAGEMGREMGKEYMAQIEKMRNSHSRLKGKYYILVYHYQQAPNPRAQYITLCSMRKKDIPEEPVQGCDLWEVDNHRDSLKLLWTLPHRESWKQLEKSPHLDKQLKTYMQQYKKGKNDRRSC